MSAGHGGPRIGSGPKAKMVDSQQGPMNPAGLPKDASPLEFLLCVMRDPRFPLDRRLHAAISAAPYCHSRAVLKEARGRATEAAAGGKFAPAATPLRLIGKPDSKPAA